MPQKSEPKHEDSLKAGALLCPVCCVQLIEVEENFELDGTVFQNVKLLKCPVCQEEQFTQEQQKAIEKKLSLKP
ncbi:MAG TPA: hypothetical protein VMD05_06375 [Candidatus Nanoarchaeia archaeon]|nr:hypothetical protein [Candidatus Nanoarchaeia archaeon]